MLQKLRNFYVLDITGEITLLREIKDIQDELNIMIIVFDDQTQVLSTMERIVHSTEHHGETLLDSNPTDFTKDGLWPRSHLTPPPRPGSEYHFGQEERKPNGQQN